MADDAAAKSPPPRSARPSTKAWPISSGTQNQNGSWTEYPNNPGGVTALCTLALLNAGVPIDDEQMQRALGVRSQLAAGKDLRRALQTMVSVHGGAAKRFAD